MRKISRRPALLIACVVAAIILSRAWLILIAGSDVPFWDQWDGEALAIYKPYLEGTLRFSDLFRPHNEHRIVFTHLLNLALLEINGQWDPLVQMIVNAAIHSITAGLFATFAIRRTAGWERTFLIVLLLAIFCLPFGWQNTLWAFQSSFYFSVLFSLAALGFVGLANGRLSWGIAGLAFAAASLLSVGTAVAVGGALVVLGLVRIRDGGRFRPGLTMLGVGAAIAVIAILATPDVPGHAPYRAQTLVHFVRPFLGSLSWPFTGNPLLSLVTNAPLIALVVLRLLRRTRTDDLQDASILLGAWAAAIGAGFAYYRGGLEIGSLVPASRYLDFLCFLIPANALAAVSIARRSTETARTRLVLLGVVWGGFVSAGLTAFTVQGWNSIIRPRIENPDFRTTLITLLQRTGDPTLIENYPMEIHPMPNVPVLQEALAVGAIEAILPPSIHPGISVEFGNGDDAVFSKGGFFQPGTPPGYYPMRTSFSRNGANRTGAESSEPFAFDGGMEITIAGVLPTGGGSIAMVNEEDGSEVAFLDPGDPRHGWSTACRRLESGTYRMRVSAANPDGWFAFSLPRPVGPLSMIVREAKPYATWLLVLASACGLVAVLAAGLSKNDSSHHAEEI